MTKTNSIVNYLKAFAARSGDAQKQEGRTWCF